MRRSKILWLSLLLWLAAVNGAAAINLDVRSFSLQNGMLFLVVERPAVPQVACRLAIRAGSALEDAGKTGIAHLLEHMMFKGTRNFGTRDFHLDEQLQQRIEAAYQVILREQRKREPDRALIAEKRAEMAALRQEVQRIYVPQAFFSQLGRNGAVGVNAFTSTDQTQYTASVPADMLEQWFSIISEQLFEPAWREFHVEKEVVRREWAFRYINNPGGAAWLDLKATVYTAHPYRNPTIGWPADMETFNATDAAAFHSRYYNPNNAVCVLVGDVTLSRVRELAERYFVRYPAGERASERVTREPPQAGPRRSIRYLSGARTPLVRIAFHTAPMGSRDFFALDALTMILSYGRSARLNQRLIDKGLAVSAWAHQPDQRYGGLFVLGGSPNEPERLEAVGDAEARRTLYRPACEKLEALLEAELEEIKRRPVSARELERIKKLNRRQFLERLRSNEDLAGTLASLEVQVGWPYLIDYLDNIARVSAEEIQEAAKRFFRPENRTAVYVIPGGPPASPPESYQEIRSVSGLAAMRGYRPESFENHSRYPTPPGWRHPLSFERQPRPIRYPAAEEISSHGATIFYLADTELPLVDLAILVKAGEVDVPDARLGLTDLLEATLIRGGTESRVPQALARFLDENAIRISVSVGLEESVIRLSVMKDDWEKGLQVLQEILTRPAFPRELVDVARRQALIGLQREGGDAERVVMREGMIRHFQGHPYGRDPLKALETLPRIGREDLLAFLRTYVVPANMVLSVAGDIDRDRVVAGLGTFLEALPRTLAPARRLEEPDPTPPVLGLIHKPGQIQAQVSLWLPGVRRTHPDFWKLRLLMEVFGGSDSLLYTRLRDDLGLVYSAGFFQSYRWKAGLLLGYMGCKASATGKAIAEAATLMSALHREVPEDLFRLKRLDALNSFVFNVDTAADLVEVYARYRMRGEPLDTLERIQKAYLEADAVEAERLAGTYLQPEKLQVFVVADKDTPLPGGEGGKQTLESALRATAVALGLPFARIPLR